MDRNGALTSIEKWLVNFLTNVSKSELFSVAAEPMIKPGRPLKTIGSSLGCISSMVPYCHFCRMMCLHIVALSVHCSSQSVSSPNIPISEQTVNQSRLTPTTSCLGSPATGMFHAWLRLCKRILLRNFTASCGEGLSHKPESEWKGAALRKGQLLSPTLGSTMLGLHLCRALSFVEDHKGDATDATRFASAKRIG